MQSSSSRKANLAGRKSENIPWVPPSNVVSFVRCLRLLDLDCLDDWPGVTEQTYSSKGDLQNLKQRINCTEWSLYRLFEIYDPAETRNKLRPFFPSLTPLQSLNLRAALFRALAELKKSGILGRDVVLRKTMLDECKGEKFEETINALALVVLKKVHLAAWNEITTIESEQLIPLVVAHRVSLRAQLENRAAIKQRTQDFTDLLNEEEARLDTRRKAVEAAEAASDIETHETFSALLSRTWTGNNKWRDVLMHGRSDPQSSLLDKDFNSVWTATQQGINLNHDLAKTIEEDLTDRIAAQEARLKRWKTFEASLGNARLAREKGSKPETYLKSQNSERLAFDQHQSLHLGASEISSEIPEASLTPAHKDLIHLMQNELIFLNHPESTRKQPQRTRRQMHILSEPLTTQRFDLAETLPIIAARYEASPDEVQARADSANTAYEPGSPATPSISKGGGTLKDEEKNGFEIPEVSISPSLQHTPNPPISDKVVSPTSHHLPDSSTRNQTSSPPAPSLNLAVARTPSITSYVLDTTPLPESASPLVGSSPPTLPIKPPFHTSRQLTLVERTRQSMALLPTNSQMSTDRPHHSRVSQAMPRPSHVFPVNQFETPAKSKGPDPLPRLSSASPAGSGASTPRDRLFSDEAEYASVFKSRPRIAMSPVLSPERSRLGFDTELERDLEDLTLSEGVGKEGEVEDSVMSSPIRRGGGV